MKYYTEIRQLYCETLAKEEIDTKLVEMYERYSETVNLLSHILKCLAIYQSVQFVKIFQTIFSIEEDKQNFLEFYFTHMSGSSEFMLCNMQILAQMIKNKLLE